MFLFVLKTLNQRALWDVYIYVCPVDMRIEELQLSLAISSKKKHGALGQTVSGQKENCFEAVVKQSPCLLIRKYFHGNVYIVVFQQRVS